MAHYDILAFINDLFWIFLFFSLFFFMIDELFLKKYLELTFLKHYIYVENVWVKVFIFTRIFYYYLYLQEFDSKLYAAKRLDLNDIFIFMSFLNEEFEELFVENLGRPREMFLDPFKRTKDITFLYFDFSVFFLSGW